MRCRRFVFVVVALMAAMTMSAGPAMANTVQVPVHNTINVPINPCGNTPTTGGQLNPGFGNTCSVTSIH